jgi:hypothetical protein
LQCYCSFYGVTGKNYKINTRILSDFKIWNQKTTRKRLAYLPENLGKRLSIDEIALSNGELYTILTNKEGKKGTIVAMIAGTKAQTVIAIIEKYRLNYEIQFLR